jgi:hypothetical protein
MITEQQMRMASQSMNEAMVGVVTIMLTAGDDPDSTRESITALVRDMPKVPVEGKDRTDMLLQLTNHSRTALRTLSEVLRDVLATYPDPDVAAIDMSGTEGHPDPHRAP